MTMTLLPANLPVLSALVFLPLVAAAVTALLKDDLAIRRTALVAGLLECLLLLPLLDFRNDLIGFQFVELRQWLPALGMTYALGVDGLSLLLVALSALLLPLCVLCSWTYIGRRVKEFHICLLLMISACVGVFTALDFVLFYIFWEAMLIPMYLLIAVWGGPNKRYASIKFFLYTLAGSTLLLVALVAFRAAGGTFFIPDLMIQEYGPRFQTWMFLCMALAFAIKVPMFPFHTWLPAAHVEAPSAGSVLLASVLLKMGTYGFLRFCLPLTPHASLEFAPLMIAVSIASIIYGGLTALGQSDMKRLIAYSSVAHMGFVTLGIFVFNQPGLEGAVIQMINHGVTTGALFMLVGAVYERSHSREIKDHLGLGKLMPAYVFFFGLFSLASLAFPGTNGFVGELLALIGAFRHSWIVGLLAAPGAMLGAAYMLRLLQKLAFAKRTDGGGSSHWFDLRPREVAYLLPLAFLAIYLGLSPGPALRTMTASVASTLQTFHQRTAPPAVASAAAAVLDAAAGGGER